MNLDEIANALAEACRTGGERGALETLYADDAVSVEAYDQGNGRITEGKAGISGKHDWWEANFEALEASVGGPHLHPGHGDVPDRFVLTFTLKAKFVETGEVSDMSEAGIYTVAGGKIVREEFF
ncbi:MAG: nuclear transport factor 2 family protein, partial [Pseudomonadota bacterium]